MGCHFLLQRIFLTQGSNPGLPHCRQTLYHLSHQESPICKLFICFCLLFNCTSSLYILDIDLLSEIGCKYFLPFCKFLTLYLFTLFMISFAVQNLFYFDKDLYIFAFAPCAFSVMPQKSLLRPMSRTFSLYFLLAVICLQELESSL